MEDDEKEKIDIVENNSKDNNDEIDEDRCPICLDHFCYLCILQWSDLSQQCPLCKSDYLSLLYDVKSNKDYKRHIINNNDDEKKKNQLSTNNNIPSPYPSNRRNYNNNSQRTNGGQRNVHFLPSGVNTFNDEYSFRRSIYARGVKAVPMVPPFKLHLTPSMINGSFAYWKNRLEPWIKREIQSILQNDNVEILEELVMSILRRHDINSQECKTTLTRFLHSKTSLFLHELLCFATSSYSIQTYDSKVIYDHTNQTNNNSPPLLNSSPSNTNTTSTSTTTTFNNDQDDNKNNEPITNLIKRSKSLGDDRHIPTILTEILEETRTEERHQRQRRRIENVLDDIEEPYWLTCSTDTHQLQDTIHTLNNHLLKLEKLMDDINPKK